MVMAAAYVHAVLLNPNSGVGQQQETVFNDVVNIAREFSTYSSWYGVDGFFVDEMYHWGKLILPFVRMLERRIKR